MHKMIFFPHFSKIAISTLLLCAVAFNLNAASKKKEAKSSGKMPEWTNNPGKVYPSASYLTGVGQAVSKNDAELQAVTQIASIFGQDVSGTTIASSRMTQFIASDGSATNESDSSISQSTKSKVKQDNLIGIEVKESYLDEKHNTWYVLAVMDKAKVTDMYNNMLNRNSQEISLLRGQVAASSDKYTLDNFVRLDFARELALASDGYLKRLTVINPVAANKISSSIVSVSEIQKQAKDLAVKIPICINVTNDTDGRIAKAFAEVMTNEGFNTTTGSNERYVINCDVMYDESQSSDGKTKFYNYTVTASLKDTSIGEELIPLSFTGREGSPTIENAKQRARNTIVNKIKQNFKVQFQKYLQSSAI